MDDLLVELTRSPDARVALTLKIEGTSSEAGYPSDVVGIVTANARNLMLGEGELGFETD